MLPVAVMLSCIGAHNVNGNGFGILLPAGFGLAGHLFAALDGEPAPLLLGFVLGGGGAGAADVHHPSRGPQAGGSFCGG